MVIRAKIDVNEFVQERESEFRVNSRIYTDPEIFELELEKIFYRTWVYVGHETEIPQGGDYKAAYIGRQPVIMARHTDDNQIYVFFNRCRHRGTTVCQQEYGNASFFRCSYHGWVYNNKGDLIGVPFPEGYGEGFDLSKMGLVQVSRVDSYRGYVFASLSPDGPTLLEYLGNARPCLDRIVDMGLEVSKGVHKFYYNGNWKLQYENTVDNYHAFILHKSFFEIIERRIGGRLSGTVNRTRDLGNGHTTLLNDPLDPDWQAPEWGIDFHVGIFPNLDLLPNERSFPNQIRVIRPISVDRTEVMVQPMLKIGAAPEVNFDRLRRYEEFFGPAGFAAPDDWEVFNRVQQGIQAKGEEWVLFSRGLNTEEVDERGIRTNRDVYGEASQRGIYRYWKRIMAAD